MTLVLVAVVAVHLLQSRGRAVAAFFLVMGGLAAFPRILTTLTSDMLTFRTSISTPNFEIRAAHVVLLLAVLLVPIALRRPHVSVPLFLATILMAVIAFAQDDLPTHVMVGLAQWAFIALAWAVGAALASEFSDGRISERALSLMILFPVAANGVIAFLQVLGLRAAGSVDLGGEALSRVSGEQAHSGILGKVLLLLVILALPLTQSRDVVARRAATLSVAASFVVTGLTYSRANTAAIVSVVGIWYLFSRGGSALRRFTIPLLIALASIPFIGVLLERNEFDAQGGSRPQLTEAALVQLKETFWFGVGPNDYQATVGQFSPISNFLPVHNSFLLTLVEAGALVSVLIAVPMMLVLVSGVRLRRKDGYQGLMASAVTAAAPGLIVVLYTGFSMSSHHIAMSFFFVLGFAGQLMRDPESRKTDFDRAGSRLPARYASGGVPDAQRSRPPVRSVAARATTD